MGTRGPAPPIFVWYMAPTTCFHLLNCLLKNSKFWLRLSINKPHGTVGRFLVRGGKIRLPKVNTLSFEGHVTPNEDEIIKKQYGENLDIVLKYRNSPLVFSFHAYWRRRQTEICRFLHKFRTSVTLTLTWPRVTWHTVVCHSSTFTYTIFLPIHIRFRSNGKTFCGRTYGH